MVDTARSIITTSLQWNKAYSPSEPILDSDAELALDQLNSMLDSWSNDSRACFAILENSFTLQIGVASYTIGTGGVINTTRPIRLIEGPGAAYLQDTNNNNYPIQVVTRDKWNQIGLRTSTSNVPDTLFYDPQFPLGVIHIFPVPSIAYTVFFDSFQVLTQLATLSTSFSMPPGYKAAVTSNLSIWLKPFFKSASIDPDLKKIARDSLMLVKRSNRRTPIAIFDSYIVSRARSTYNIYTDNRGV